MIVLLGCFLGFSASAVLQETLDGLVSASRELHAAIQDVQTRLEHIHTLETQVQLRVASLLEDIHGELLLNQQQVADILTIRLESQGIWIQTAMRQVGLPAESTTASAASSLPSRMQWREGILTHLPHAGSFWGPDETIMVDAIGRATIRSLNTLEARFQGQDLLAAYQEFSQALRLIPPGTLDADPIVHAAAVRGLQYLASLQAPMTEICLYHGMLPPLGLSLLRIEELYGLLWLASNEVSSPFEAKKALFKALASSQTAHNDSPFFDLMVEVQGGDQPSCPKGFFVRALEALDHLHPAVSLGQLEMNPTPAHIAEAVKDVIQRDLLREGSGEALRLAADNAADDFLEHHGLAFQMALLQGLETRFPLVHPGTLSTFIGPDELAAYVQYFLDSMEQTSSDLSFVL